MKNNLLTKYRINYFSFTFSRQIILLIFCNLLFIRGNHAIGQTKPCTVNMNWIVNPNNPLEIQFISDGNFEPGSFSFTAIWDFGDGNTSTDSCISHTYAMPGTYEVCLHATMCIGGGLCCSDSACRFLTVGQMTLLPEVSAQAIDLSIFPNPTSGRINITSIENFNIRIYNRTGALIEEGSTIDGQMIFDLEKYGMGIYYYYASDPSGKQVKCGKILVR